MIFSLLLFSLLFAVAAASGATVAAIAPVGGERTIANDKINN